MRLHTEYIKSKYIEYTTITDSFRNNPNKSSYRYRISTEKGKALLLQHTIYFVRQCQTHVAKTTGDFDASFNDIVCTFAFIACNDRRS